ncbi:MAG TPA: hypothetical protein VNM89_07560 [Solirubrobacterales bacterium]|nr:hypothetical protein [Solirubrobacterales bacterium]
MERVADPQRSAARFLVIATDELRGDEVIGELRRHLQEGESEVMVITPAVEETRFRHALGDIDSATIEAKRRLDASLAELRGAGIPAMGEVGDSDPLTAATDALQRYPADEVLIVAHAEDQARWFEDGLFERAQETLYPALHMVAVRRDGKDGEPHLAGVEEAGPGRRPSVGRKEVEISPNLPRFTRGDLLGIVVAVVGTIAAIVLAATGPGVESPAGAAQILLAMGVALVNMAHVVGLTLQESVDYHGGWQSFFRDLSLTVTPLAILVNALISILD